MLLIIVPNLTLRAVSPSKFKEPLEKKINKERKQKRQEKKERKKITREKERERKEKERKRAEYNEALLKFYRDTNGQRGRNAKDKQ